MIRSKEIIIAQFASKWKNLNFAEPNGMCRAQIFSSSSSWSYFQKQTKIAVVVFVVKSEKI